jgi:hypothetical protein
MTSFGLIQRQLHIPWRKLAFSRFPFRVSRFPLEFWKQNGKPGTENRERGSKETVSLLSHSKSAQGLVPCCGRFCNSHSRPKYEIERMYGPGIISIDSYLSIAENGLHYFHVTKCIEIRSQ